MQPCTGPFLCPGICFKSDGSDMCEADDIRAEVNSNMEERKAVYDSGERTA